MRTSKRLGLAASAAALVVGGCGLLSEASETMGGDSAILVATELPLQGPVAAASEAANNMMQLHLEQQGNLAGVHAVALTSYDEAGDGDGAWDAATCARNAQDHVSSPDEIAVIGTRNSGCAKILVPVLNQDPSGPMLMVSPTSTNPGLTKAWDPGEPEIFYPTGERNFARVVTTDEHQGAAAAQFLAQERDVKACFVIHDDSTYGRGVAKAFLDEAEQRKLKTLGAEPWNAQARDYKKLFAQIRTLKADCLYVAGNYESNGELLFSDKQRFLGDNRAITTVVSDGFAGVPDFQAQSEAQGVYVTFPGLASSTLIAESPRAGALARAYEERFGELPDSNAAFYAVAALQVVLAAIENSDGTRPGVTQAVFGDQGITIPADESVLGRRIAIDPKTGDVDNRDITIARINNERQVVVTTWPKN